MITPWSYCKTLRWGESSLGVILLDDNMLSQYGYKKCLANYFHTFIRMKVWLRKKQFATEKEIQSTLKNRLIKQRLTFYQEVVEIFCCNICNKCFSSQMRIFFYPTMQVREISYNFLIKFGDIDP